MEPLDVLVSLPPRMAGFLNSDDPRARFSREKWAGDGPGQVFFGHDPQGISLGSGGGTVYLLWSAWQAETGGDQPLLEWLRGTQKVIVHAGGESRRLPAYAPVGKCFCPLPDVPGIGSGPVFRPLLRDQQVPFYRRAMEEAGSKARVLVTSGDVWIQASALEIPALEGDIVGVGMPVGAETAQYFGVYLVESDALDHAQREIPVCDFFQKPRPERLLGLPREQRFLVDTGMWFLSEEAVLMLFKACGWQRQNERFSSRTGQPLPFDLYGEVGESLGRGKKAGPRLAKAGLERCTATVVVPRSGHFLHLGSNRQLFASLSFLQRHEFRLQNHFFIDSDPDLFPLAEGEHTGPVWVESCEPSVPLKLCGHQLVTGLPKGVRMTALPAEICLDVLPVGDGLYLFRPYHIDETYRGTVESGGQFLGQPLANWLTGHQAPEDLRGDIYDLPLYPVLRARDWTDELMKWLLEGGEDADAADRYWGAERLSAREIAGRTEVADWLAHREKCFNQRLRKTFLRRLARSNRLDYAALADWGKGQRGLRKELAFSPVSGVGDPLARSRWNFLQAEMGPTRERETFRETGRAILRETLLRYGDKDRSRPYPCLKDDQIVWARSPARLDLAGGWSDTPPYCLRHGGRVVNMAVLLNEQAPIQAFVRFTPEKYLRIRSIDLGTSVIIRSYEELACYTDPSSGFSLPLAAFALAGFHPAFAAKTFTDLEEQLGDFGYGLELTMLCAIPKGSGLGTSSILGATLLGALNRAVGLGWDAMDLYWKVLAMEQLLTTGGGWQDQAGALFPGLKMIETEPGLNQKPVIRQLPDAFFSPERANYSILLYYTGLTRLAKGILGEIVNKMFLGETHTERIVADLKDNAARLGEAIQVGQAEEIYRCVRRSWRLNQQLDPGTTNPAIEALLDKIGPDLVAAKLLGAGGGGYILLFARDAAAGLRIRETLDRDPPNDRARFVDFRPAPRPLAVTVS